MNTTISLKDFLKVEMRVGTILTAEHFIEAHNPSYKLTIDFGEYGIRKSSAQITKHYEPEALIGTQVIAVLNFPPKQIANIMSACLVLAALDENEEAILLQPEKKVKNGSRIG